MNHEQIEKFLLMTISVIVFLLSTSALYADPPGHVKTVFGAILGICAVFIWQSFLYLAITVSGSEK